MNQNDENKRLPLISECEKENDTFRSSWKKPRDVKNRQIQDEKQKNKGLKVLYQALLLSNNMPKCKIYHKSVK